MKRRLLLGTAAGAVGGLAGCLRSRGSTDDHDVGMSSGDFLPERVEVAAGTTVVWKNTSNRAHTVTAYDDGVPAGGAYFASGGYGSESAAREGWQGSLGGAIRTGEFYEHRFEVPGEYAYFCIPHEPGGMVGTVVVTD